MHEVILKTYELIDELNNSDIVKELLSDKEILLKDISFLDKIKMVRENEYMSKKDLYDNVFYKRYMDNYNKLFFIVININQKYKNITNSKGCIK